MVLEGFIREAYEHTLKTGEGGRSPCSGVPPNSRNPQQKVKRKYVAKVEERFPPRAT